jgi:putative flippase GtrA
MIESFIRYAMVGAVGTLVHYLVLLTLVERVGVPPTVATTVGFSAGAVVNYFLNIRITFRSDRPHREALPRFVAVAAGGMLLNAGIVALGANLFRLHYMIPQVCATAIVVFCTFCANRVWTFQRRNP